jgi:hypothetical protein
MKKILFTVLVIIGILFANMGYSQIFKKHYDKKLKLKFPPVLDTAYVDGSLGALLQEKYKEQARAACGIYRSDFERNYIPKDIIESYGENYLKDTKVFTVNFSAVNIFFLALNDADITKLENNTLTEDEYIKAKKIIGINDNLIDFGQTSLSPITGFPSFFYQKSCGSYFESEANNELKAPVAELETSLSTETEKESSITTISGKFISPLYLIFRKNTIQSIYAHLLLWEIYKTDFISSPSKDDLLIDNGKYISEFDGTLSNIARGYQENIQMNGILTASYSAGIINTNGKIQSGFENQTAFSLSNFNTSIHKLSNGDLLYATSPLPSVDEINEKLQNSMNFSDQKSFDGFVNHINSITIERTLAGVPAYLCNAKSWMISDLGYDDTKWESKPSVVSSFIESNEVSFPQCICKITGNIKEETIKQAIENNGLIDLQLKLENIIEIKGNKLKFEITEPSLRVTDAPKIMQVNSEGINARRKKVTQDLNVEYNYNFDLDIDYTGVVLSNPLKISDLTIEYINDTTSLLYPVCSSNLNKVNIVITTMPKPESYVEEGEIVLPIKIKFKVYLADGSSTQLSTNVINLRVPNLIEEKAIETKIIFLD